MPTRLFLRGTQTEPSTGGNSYDLLPDMGAGNGSVQFSFNDTAFVEAGRFVRQLSDAPTETTFPSSVNIESIEGTIEFRFRVGRFTSAGTFIEGGTYSALYTTVGVKAETLNFTPSAWNSGDILALTMEGRRTGGHGTVRFNVSVGDTDSYLDATLPAAAPDPINAPVDAVEGVTDTSTADTLPGAITVPADGADEATEAALASPAILAAEVEAVVWSIELHGEPIEAGVSADAVDIATDTSDAGIASGPVSLSVDAVDGVADTAQVSPQIGLPEVEAVVWDIFVATELIAQEVVADPVDIADDTPAVGVTGGPATAVATPVDNVTDTTNVIPRIDSAAADAVTIDTDVTTVGTVLGAITVTAIAVDIITDVTVIGVVAGAISEPVTSVDLTPDITDVGVVAGVAAVATDASDEITDIAEPGVTGGATTVAATSVDIGLDVTTVFAGGPTLVTPVDETTDVASPEVVVAPVLIEALALDIVAESTDVEVGLLGVPEVEAVIWALSAETVSVVGEVVADPVEGVTDVSSASPVSGMVTRAVDAVDETTEVADAVPRTAVAVADPVEVLSDVAEPTAVAGALTLPVDAVDNDTDVTLIGVSSGQLVPADAIDIVLDVSTPEALIAAVIGTVDPVDAITDVAQANAIGPSIFNLPVDAIDIVMDVANVSGPRPDTFPVEVWEYVEQALVGATPIGVRGASVSRANSGRIKTRTFTQAGAAWQEDYGDLQFGRPETEQFIAGLRNVWFRGETMSVVHPLTPGSGLPHLGSATGAITVSGAGQTGNTINMAGFTPNREGVFLPGTWIAIQGINRRFEVVARADSNASGVAAVTISPTIYSGMSPNNSAIVTYNDVHFNVHLAKKPDLPTLGDGYFWRGLRLHYIEKVNQ